jgi:hypothetical protein
MPRIAEAPGSDLGLVSGRPLVLAGEWGVRRLVSSQFCGKVNLRNIPNINTKRINIIKKNSYPEYSIAVNNKQVWEELIAYFPLIRFGPHRKRRVIAVGMLLPSSDRRAHGPTHSYNSSSNVACICCCGSVFTEPLPINERGDELYRSVA